MLNRASKMLRRKGGEGTVDGDGLSSSTSRGMPRCLGIVEEFVALGYDVIILVTFAKLENRIPGKHG